jgi:7,8-dihydroneopterin aldolase/epimerase/oxygenase
LNPLIDFTGDDHPRRQPTAAAPPDAIFIRDFRVQTLIGVYPQERRSRQTLRLDLDIGVASNRRWTSDQLGDTVDYGMVVQRVRSMLETCQFFLLETLAEHVADLILDEFEATWVRIRIAKTSILPNVGEVGFCIQRDRLRPSEALNAETIVCLTPAPSPPPRRA